MTAIAADLISCSVARASELTGISTSRLYDLLNRGLIESRYEGSKRLVLAESLRDYIGALPSERDTS